uniref:Uncharacterized protein n=1 Tax=Arundo donax TaxID=35708 RepID=A0A0A9A124_ARUDO
MGSRKTKVALVPIVRLKK